MAAEGAPGAVVVVVVVLLVVGDVVVVVVDGDVVVVVVVVVVEEDVVVVDLGGAVVLVVVVGGGSSGGVDVRKFPAEVPPELLEAPISEERGLPPTTSTSVTRPSASTNDATTVTTIGQLRVRHGLGPSPAGGADVVRPTRLQATSRVSPTSSASGPPPAPACSPSVSRAGSAPRAGSDPCEGVVSEPASAEASIAEDRASAATSPAPLVAQRWTSGSRGPFFTTASRTLECVRSIDSQTMAVTVVATMLPTATPITVPDTPKSDASSAESTAPLADAAIWTGFSRFICSRRRRGPRRAASRAGQGPRRHSATARAYPCAPRAQTRAQTRAHIG